MASAGKEIEKKASAMAKALNAAAKKARDKKIAELKKAAKSGKNKKDKAKTGGKAAKDPDEQLWRVEFTVSNYAANSKRTPEQQAEIISKGNSDTCSSAHVVDNARHVSVFAGAPGSKKASFSRSFPGAAFGAKDEHFLTLSEFKSAWNAQLKAQGLRNYANGKKFAAADPFHVELPGSKVPRGDPQIAACMKHYAKITRIDGAMKNGTFEGKFQASLKPFLDAAEAEFKKIQLKDARFTGEITFDKMLCKSKVDVSFRQKIPGEITFQGPLDAGKAKTSKIAHAHTFDVQGPPGVFGGADKVATVAIRMSYKFTIYENLAQSFLSDVEVSVLLKRAAKASKDVVFDVQGIFSMRLRKTADWPTGKLVLSVLARNGAKKEERSIGQLLLDGAKGTFKK